MKATARYPLAPVALAAWLLFAGGPPAPAAAVSPQGASAAAPADPLAFPKDAFTEETVTVRTARGEKTVVYRSYRHIPYVAKPVDKDYQSLDVRVPVRVDGVAVDASKAPILFATSVGGYVSVNNAAGPRAGGMGGRGTGGPPPGAGPGPAGGRGMGGPAGHGADQDAEDFIAWIAKIAGFAARR